MDAKLKDIFDNVNSWLKFAESKNAALIAFNSAAGFGLASLLASSKLTLSPVHVYACLCILLLGLGAVAGLISFLPRLRIPWSFSKTRINAWDNLLFFGHIARYTPERYLDSLSKLVETEARNFTDMQRIYAEQIVINSQITMYKYRCFTVGLWFTLSAFATPIAPLIGLIIYLARRRKTR